MKQRIYSTLLIATLALPFSANANQIIIELLPGGQTPGSINGLGLTPFAEPDVPLGGCGYFENGATSTPSPISGDVQFVTAAGDPLCMTVQDPAWWQWDHGNVFTTGVPWVELIMPAGTRAFTLFSGANIWGRGWIEGIDSDGNRTRRHFGGNTEIPFGPGSTPGFGVYGTGSCSTITRIIIEPFEWGTGNFAINQDPCVTAVPEPAPIFLLGLGLLGLAITRHRTSLRRQRI